MDFHKLSAVFVTSMRDYMFFNALKYVILYSPSTLNLQCFARYVRYRAPLIPPISSTIQFSRTHKEGSFSSPALIPYPTASRYPHTNPKQKPPPTAKTSTLPRLQFKRSLPKKSEPARVPSQAHVISHPPEWAADISDVSPDLTPVSPTHSSLEALYFPTRFNPRAS